MSKTVNRGFSVQQLANLSKRSVPTIRRHIKAGTLEGCLEKGAWVIEQKSAQEFLLENKKEWTAREIAKVFGVSVHTADGWMRKRWVEFCLVDGRRVAKGESLRRFIAERSASIDRETYAEEILALVSLYGTDGVTPCEVARQTGLLRKQVVIYLYNLYRQGILERQEETLIIRIRRSPHRRKGHRYFNPEATHPRQEESPEAKQERQEKAVLRLLRRGATIEELESALHLDRKELRENMRKREKQGIEAAIAYMEQERKEKDLVRQEREELESAICKMWLDGESRSFIARTLRIHGNTITAALRKHNLSPPTPKQDPDAITEDTYRERLEKQGIPSQTIETLVRQKYHQPTTDVQEASNE